LVAATAGVLVPASGTGAQPPQAINISISGPSGNGVFEKPGRLCSENADGEGGAYWHYNYGAPLNPGAFGAIPGELRYNLDLHSEPAGAPIASYNRAFLQGTDSKAALQNERGVMRLALSAGSCTNKTLNFDGTTVSGGGTWAVEGADGSYRQATGSGTFTIGNTSVAPGADNPFALTLNGVVDVLDPALQVEWVQSYWGFLGADYALRQVTVIYKITNIGEGDAYGVKLSHVSSPTNGVTVKGPVPQKLGDLAAGESEEVRVRYALGLLQPCTAVILNCQFQTRLGVTMPDALDAPVELFQTVHVKAPNLPPPIQ
jgi:hypothetical protein